VSDPPAIRALVVDDERNIRNTLALCLERMGCRPVTAATAEAALEALRHDAFDLVFLDLHLGNTDGLRLLPRLLAERPGLAVVVITAYAAIETAVKAVQGGAVDYLPKPFSAAQVQFVVDRVLRAVEQGRHTAIAEVDLETSSPRTLEALRILERAAPFEVSVLLRGESGTGKGVLARWLHARSPRAARPFVVVNCPTLSGELLASELFGHARGAFTGAVRDQPGIVEAASGGTLFLDEISEIPPPLQAKLLRFLQDKEFERVGESLTRRADVRIVAATNRNLELEVAAGTFREDLLYRLNVVEVSIPPLRERKEDIPRLARTLIASLCRQIHREAPELPKTSEQLLAAYDWPGNVRELRNVLERALLLWRGESLDPKAFPRRIVRPRERGPQPGDHVTLEVLEREHIERVVASAPSFEVAAKILGIDESTLRRKRRRWETSDHDASLQAVPASVAGPT